MRKICVYVGIFHFILMLPLSGQIYGPDEFSPFVSRLKATVSDIAIVLTWQNPKGVDGKIHIYRHTEKINEENIEDAVRIATLEIDRESYVDYPDDIDEYFYAVLIEDREGTAHRMFIPYRNITVSGVFIRETETEKERAGTITDLKAVVKDQTIVITFKTTKAKRSYLLYRNTGPILDTDDLIQSMTPVTLEGKTGYTDSPIAGIDYYYAVLDAGLVKIGEIHLEPGKNTLTKPVTIPLGKAISEKDTTKERSLPLPYISILSDVEYGNALISSVSSYLPEEKKLKKETEKTVDNLLKDMTFPHVPGIKMQILDIDTTATEGEAAAFQNIVNGLFAKNKFDSAELKIKDFLKINHADDLEARAYFYLGQIYYFKDTYEDAFLAFLMAQDMYYVEVQPWLQACFEKLMK